MDKKSIWNDKSLWILHDMVVKKGLSFEDVSKVVGVSPGSCERKYRRTDWDSFKLGHKAPKQNTKWSDDEIKTLYVMKRESRSETPYIEIAKKLHRSPISVERKYQTTNWNDIYPGATTGTIDEEDEVVQQVKNADKNNMAFDLVDMSRGEIQRLLDRTEDDFLSKTQRSRDDLDEDFNFEEIKKIAVDIMRRQGHFYPESKEFSRGRFLVVGDSHGKETTRGLFSMIKKLDQELNFGKIIHIGHILDDEWDISCCWEDFKDKLIVVAKKEELEILAGRTEKYDLVKKQVKLGSLTVKNQDIVTNEYSVGLVGNATNKDQYFDDTTIINLHRIEIDTRTTDDRTTIQVYTPGCLCRRHVSVNLNMNASFNKRRKASRSKNNATMRRKDHQTNFWEQGLCIVDLDNCGEYSITACPIHEIDGLGFATSYGGSIYTEDRVCKPDMKIFVNADPHSDLHDPACLDIQEQICKAYSPDKLINLGDVFNAKSFNHHMIERNEHIDKDAMYELAATRFILSKMRTWAKEMHLLFGNHERFIIDFCKKMPQFSRLLDFSFLVGLESLDIQLVNHKEPLYIGPVVFIHGDLVMYGARGGNKMDKARQTFGNNVIMGHQHCPATRQSCHVLGHTGMRDQGYNEPHASKWTQGYAYCNIFKGKAFVHNMTMKPGKGMFAGRLYLPKAPEQWTVPPFKATISYDFK